VFEPRPASHAGGAGKPPFVISIPPPNVTGSLTMGHLLGESVRDLVLRWQRMEGRETLYVPGMDHAGIATQNVVEKRLRENGRSRHDLGREAFLREVWAWKEQYGGLILKQLRGVGVSADWTRERFTLDPDYSRAVMQCFLKLHEKGLIYRGRYIVNWCPRCLTALSDEEVDHEETQGSLWHVRYPIKGSEKFITVATTRPETNLGDNGVAVHPKPALRAPDRQDRGAAARAARIPIVADGMVDQFGTGAVKITPAHDANDFLTAQRHDLPELVVMDERGVMNENAGDFRGLDRFEARTKIVQSLKDAGYLEKVEPHTLSVGHCSRCDTVIEPYLSWQWFVKMKPLAEPAIEAAKRGKVKFYPARWRKVYLNWLENIRDWCISRQLWWEPSHRCGIAARGRSCRSSARRRRLDAGRGRARHVVLRRGSGHSRSSAGPRDRRPEALLPERPDGDRQRHHLLLGRAHGDGRLRIHGQGAVHACSSRASCATCRAGRCRSRSATRLTRS
jgi:valyl-tRNA synthetase